MDTITSVKNTLIADLRKLLSKNGRSESSRFIIEGEKIIFEALKSGIEITDAVYDIDASVNEQLLCLLKAKGCNIICATNNVVSALCETKTPLHIIGICKMRKNSDEIINDQGLCIVLDQIRDPGNMGTIIRTAEAMGISLIIACGCVDIYNPKVVRAAAGSLFRQNIILFDDTVSVILKLKEMGYNVYASALHRQSVSIDRFDICPPCAIVIGNEGAGVSQDCIDICHGTVTIPMAGPTESLNASVAASIIMWEMMKAERERGWDDKTDGVGLAYDAKRNRRGKDCPVNGEI